MQSWHHEASGLVLGKMINEQHCALGSGDHLSPLRRSPQGWTLHSLRGKACQGR